MHNAKFIFQYKLLSFIEDFKYRCMHCNDDDIIIKTKRCQQNCWILGTSAISFIIPCFKLAMNNLLHLSKTMFQSGYFACVITIMAIIDHTPTMFV